MPSTPYDILKRHHDGSFIWLEAASELSQAKHRLSVKALGLNKLNDVRELKDSPQVRGLINKVHYLVQVEE